jgi:hypothetical protein
MLDFEVEERSMRAWQVVKHGEPKEVMELGEKAARNQAPVRSGF